MKQILINDSQEGQAEKNKKFYAVFYQNLRDGINYYFSLQGIASSGREAFLRAVDFAGIELDYMNYQFIIK